VGNSESDIAIEEVDPFDSHFLYETWLSVPEPFVRNAKYDGAKNLLFSNMIRKMWPELLDFPINPPYSKADKMNAFLHKIGFDKHLKHILYRFDELKYNIGTVRGKQP